MKKYMTLSVLLVASLMLISGAANSLIVSNDPAPAVMKATAINGTATCGTAIKCVPSSECKDGPCEPCTPEECAKRLGVDVKAIHKAMSECENRSAMSGHMISSGKAVCSPADCDPTDCDRSDCVKTEQCKSRTDCTPKPGCNMKSSGSSI